MLLWGSGRRLLILGALCVLTAACADLPPTKTANPLNVSPDRSDIVSVCYDDGDHGRAEIEAVALEACGKGATAVTPWQVDKYLNDCPMLKKSRISFMCVSPGG
ncbi:MAG: hypothetical protein GKS00_26275 [Alphaproteobacteria bacterium]|nr:hypothetical protein [Alphaproteobacteria bacterium]